MTWQAGLQNEGFHYDKRLKLYERISDDGPCSEDARIRICHVITPDRSTDRCKTLFLQEPHTCRTDARIFSSSSRRVSTGLHSRYHASPLRGRSDVNPVAPGRLSWDRPSDGTIGIKIRFQTRTENGPARDPRRHLGSLPVAYGHTSLQGSTERTAVGIAFRHGRAYQESRVLWVGQTPTHLHGLETPRATRP
jgi:hypothetical protein